MDTNETKYYFYFDEDVHKYSIDSPSFEVVLNKLQEDLFYDIFYDFLRNSIAYEKAKGHNFIWEDINDVYKTNEIKNHERYLYICNNEQEILQSYPLVEIYKVLIDDFLSSENGEIAVCALWSRQLENFIEKSTWNIALLTGDGKLIMDIKEWPSPTLRDDQLCYSKDGMNCKPLIWYGIKGDEVIEDWVLQENGMLSIVKEEDGMGGYGGQMRINGLEINYLNLFTENDGSWYFGACGEKGADFHKVINTCPVNLSSIYKRKNGNQVIERYFLDLQKSK